jgi:hypothetical protein
MTVCMCEVANSAEMIKTDRLYDIHRRYLEKRTERRYPAHVVIRDSRLMMRSDTVTVRIVLLRGLSRAGGIAPGHQTAGTHICHGIRDYHLLLNQRQAVRLPLYLSPSVNLSPSIARGQ